MARAARWCRRPAGRSDGPGTGGRGRDRLRRMQLVLRAVPLAKPMTEYKLNSGFGYRRDPLNRRSAMHTGQDFGGPRQRRGAGDGPWRGDRGGPFRCLRHHGGDRPRHGPRDAIRAPAQGAGSGRPEGGPARPGRGHGANRPRHWPTPALRDPPRRPSRSIPLRSSRPAASSCSSPAAEAPPTSTIDASAALPQHPPILMGNARLSFVGEPFQHDVFVSYAHAERETDEPTDPRLEPAARRAAARAAGAAP